MAIVWPLWPALHGPAPAGLAACTWKCHCVNGRESKTVLLSPEDKFRKPWNCQIENNHPSVHSKLTDLFLVTGVLDHVPDVVTVPFRLHQGEPTEAKLVGPQRCDLNTSGCCPWRLALSLGLHCDLGKVVQLQPTFQFYCANTVPDMNAVPMLWSNAFTRTSYTCPGANWSKSTL